MTLNIPALTNNIADSTLDKITATFARIKTPQSNDPPVLTPENISERIDLRLGVLSTPVYVVDEMTDGGPTLPCFACRFITAARDYAIMRTVNYEGRAPHKARQAVISHGCVTEGDLTLTIRASTIGAVIAALPRQYAEAVEHQRKLLASDDWHKYL